MRWKAIIKKEKLLKSESFNWSIKAWVVLPRKYYPAFQYCYLIFCYSILTDFDHMEILVNCLKVWRSIRLVSERLEISLIKEK